MKVLIDGDVFGDTARQIVQALQAKSFHAGTEENFVMRMVEHAAKGGHAIEISGDDDDVRAADLVSGMIGCGLMSPVDTEDDGGGGGGKGDGK